jgi:spermidine synthase
MSRRALLLLFGLSGAAALIYEVVWTRLLTLQMGQGVAAASTVLAAFMGGLAGGAAAGGRVGQRLAPSSALRAYAWLEVAIAVLALLLPWALRATVPLLAAVYDEGHGALFPWVRLASCLILVALPALAMGATFPIASRWVARTAATAAKDAGALYAANTVGAALGAMAAGFVLLPSLGLSGTTWVAVALNIAAAAGAWALAPTGSIAPTPPEAASPPMPSRRTRARSPATRQGSPASRVAHPAIAATALAVSGFASLAFQIVWTRLLASVLGPTAYAFSTIVAVFIVGIAIGAAVASRLASRSKNPARGLATCLASSAVGAMAAARAVDWAVMNMALTVASPGAGFDDVLVRSLWLSCGLLPMTIAFGAAFPFGVAVATRRDESVAQDLGFLYAVNTLGAIAGALVAGFLLIPALGLHGALRLVSAIAVVGAGAVCWFGASSGRAFGAVAAAALLVPAWQLPSWDPMLLSSGGYKYAASIRGPDLRTALTAGTLQYYREGATATVAVRRLSGRTSLSIDGKVDASSGGDMLTQRLLAHLPLLLHPQPRTTAIIGLGSGVTAGSALTHPIERVVVLEISPEVVEGAAYFESENHRALADPRTRLVVADGRTHLLHSRESYDVIISEPSNPWMAGIASLFTREFFEAAKARLAPGGVLCQWAHTYDISAEDLRSIVATFISVFPDGTLWLVGDADVLLLGSTGPLTLRIGDLAAGWSRPGVAADLASVGVMEPFALASLFVGEGRTLAEWSGGTRLQTDEDARLEFTGPRAIVGVASGDNAKALRDLAAMRPPIASVDAMVTTASSDAWRRLGEMHYQADGYRSAYNAFARAMERNPDDEAALDGMVRASVPIDLVASTRGVLTKLAAEPGRRAARLALARLLAASGNPDESVRLMLGLLQTNPGDVPALEQLASVLADAGDAERLAPVVARLGMDAPSGAWTHYYAATLHFLQDRSQQAVLEADAALAVDPRHAKALNLKGAVLAQAGQRDRAREAFEASLRLDPREPATYNNLATLELETGNRDRARQLFAEALTVDPESTTAREGLLSILGPR